MVAEILRKQTQTVHVCLSAAGDLERYERKYGIEKERKYKKVESGLELKVGM